MNPERRLAPLVASTGALWLATAANKAVAFYFQLSLGRAGGVRILGVMVAVIACTWVAGTAASLGLPDWVLFSAAEDRRAGRPLRVEAGRGHALFVVSVLVTYAGLVVVAPALGGAPELASVARLLVVGALGQALGAYALGGLRGQGRPGLEVAVLLVGAVTLFVGTLVADSAAGLVFGWAVYGCVCGSSAIIALWVEPRLRLAHVGGGRPWRAGDLARSILAPARAALPYLVMGLSAWFIGNGDLLLGRWGCTPEEVGRLQASTVLLRAGAAGPWILATLLLHRLEARSKVRWLAVLGALLALGVGGLAWWGMDLVAWGYGIPPAPLWQPTGLAILCAPLLYAFIALLPALVARSLRRALLATVIGVGVGLLCGLLGVLQWGISGAIAGLACGQAVALVISLRSVAPSSTKGPL